MDSKIGFEMNMNVADGNTWTVCEFHGSNGNGFGDIWWTDNPIYFSSIDSDFFNRGRTKLYWQTCLLRNLLTSKYNQLSVAQLTAGTSMPLNSVAFREWHYAVTNSRRSQCVCLRLSVC